MSIITIFSSALLVWSALGFTLLQGMIFYSWGNLSQCDNLGILKNQHDVNLHSILLPNLTGSLTLLIFQRSCSSAKTTHFKFSCSLETLRERVVQ